MRRPATLRLVQAGLMGALLMVCKETLAPLPGEPVTLLIILYTLELPAAAPWAIAVFVALQFVLYGFGLWSWMYLYIWFVLCALAYRLRGMDSAPGWAVAAGLYGLAFGALMGYMIHYFKLQPFIVTLAGQFFMRGMCAVISTESIPISDEFYKTMALTKVTLLGGRIYFYVFIAIVVLLVSLFVLKFTRFGRTVYAVGGNEQSAILMGLPVARTKVAVYAISSFCAALAGVVFSFYTLAGYSLQNMGLELDAISSSVIGGTLLTGGVGNVIGTTVGVLIQGVIQTIVTYQNLNTWWTKVTIAALLCIFIVIQRVIAIRAEKAKGTAN